MYEGIGAAGSGPGSSEEYTREWRAFVQEFISKNTVMTIVDWGCGDWTHSKLIDWNNAKYFGIDIVPSLIESLNQQFADENTSFHLFDPDIISSRSLISIVCQNVDVIICKDVIQHLPNDVSIELLKTFIDSCKFLILVNDIKGNPNVDTHIGGCRHVDPRLPPISITSDDPEIMLGGGEKAVFVIKGNK